MEQFSSVQSLSHVWCFVTPWTTARQASLSVTNSGVYSNSCPWIGNAIQPFHPLLFPSPPTFNLSQHQGLFKWVSSSHQVAKILELQLQHQSFQWIFRTDFLQDGLVGSPCSSRSNSWWCQRITYSFSTKMWPKWRRLRSKGLFSGQVMSGCFVTPWTVAL